MILRHNFTGNFVFKGLLMTVFPEPTSRKLRFWLWTVLDTNQEYQTFLKKALK